MILGNYNPRQPYILGQEFVPIRDENLIYSPVVNSVEYGTTYTQQASQRIRDARFYAHHLPAPLALFQVGQVGLYPAGSEALTGPIEECIIPVNAVTVTGAGITQGGSAVPYVDSVQQPGDNHFIQIGYPGSGSPTAASQKISLYFATNSYPQLQGKRILNVSLLYSGGAQDVEVGTGAPADFINPFPTLFTMTLVAQLNDTGFGQGFTAPAAGTQTGALTLNTVVGPALSTLQGATINALNIGDINNCWDASNPAGTNEKLPWTWDDLKRFEASSGVNRQALVVGVVIPVTTGGIGGAGLSVTVRLDYFALRVIYCEETRVAYGANQFQYLYGMNSVSMRDLSRNTDPVIPAGRYTPTLSFVSMGQVGAGFGVTGEFPELNSLRELYALPSHPGVQVDVPFPLAERIGDTFTDTATLVLPQLSLHASGGTLTDPHVYGRQAAAQVYGSNTATQDIYDDISGVNNIYQQVRWYARRFGDTTIPLTLTGVGGFSGSTVSITPTDFDALTEILDGWKEVTLRFASPPSMGAAGGFPAWTWSAAGEAAGNRWEVLAASAPAISGGVPGSLYTAVPSPNGLGTATYQPTSGDTVELTWMPQGVATPFVTGATLDQYTDAVLIFSQDPPTITGVSISQLTQTVTGIGFDCGSLPCCIPSGIGYSQLTWSATTLPATGFGAYELQRFDYLAGDFQTIMLGTDPTRTSFNDFEARVGITSVYRIRTYNVLNFAGLWSAYVSGAPPTPGVVGGCGDATGALIFTTNADQSGLSNAAYVMQWERDPTEEFTLPEADMVQFQPMYGRDGSVAFHGTERGLETFKRTLLIQAGAIDPIRLADAKTLRDLAWGQFPYVCVRDDIGDRWFANVRVPNVNARLNRTKYMAQVEITELTTCPYAVDP